MSLVRVKLRSGDFFTAHKGWAEDASLSWEARGVLAYLFTKSESWEIYMGDLIKRGPCEKYKLRRILKELEERGYLHREKRRNDKGQFEWVSTIYEVAPDEPPPKESTMDSPTPDGVHHGLNGGYSNNKDNDRIRGSNNNGESGSGGSAREDLEFLGDEYRSAYGKTIRECIDRFSISSVDQLIRNQWGAQRQGRVPTSDLVALARSHDFPRLVAAVVITGNEAQTPNVRYLSSVLQGDFQSKSKSNGRSNEDIPDDPIENRKRILRAAAEGAGLTG